MKRPSEASMVGRFCGMDLADFIKGVDRATKAQKTVNISVVEPRPVPAYCTLSVEEVAGRWVYSCKDIDASIDAAREAINLTDSMHWEYSDFLRNAADNYQVCYDLSHTDADMKECIDLYERACNTISARPHSIYEAARRLAMLHISQNDWNAACTAFCLAVQQFPKMLPRYFGRQNGQDVVSKHSDIASDAALCALAAEKSACEALQLLEIGCATILGSLVDYRSDVSSLQELHQPKFEEFELLRRVLDQMPFVTESAFESTDLGVQAIKKRIISASQRFDALLLEIRQLEGFENFLSLPEEETLRNLALEDPIVIFVGSMKLNRAYAITITPQRISSTSLGGLYIDYEQPVDKELERFVLEKDVYKGKTSTLPKRNKLLFRLLDQHWETAMKPVCTELGFKPLPKSQAHQLPHVFMIRAGYPFNVMPMHALGSKVPGSVDTVSNYFISSYVPSVKTLMYAREREFTFLDREDSNMLIATMKSTPGHKPLHEVKKEAEQVKALAEGVKRSVTLLEQPTASDVLVQLANCQVAVFGCHGQLGTGDPSESALIFEKSGTKTNSHDAETPNVVDRLSVKRLSISNRNNRDTMQLAYLSACASAGSDNQPLASESIHIASSFLIAGFGHVIATLWNVNDNICVKVSKRFWELLLEGTQVEESSAARRRRIRLALHLAVEDVKQKDFEEPLLWAPFVHFGS